MTKQSKMLQLLTQIKREFNIGEPRFPHLKLKVSDISPKQDAIELYIRAKDILWNSNLPQRQVADIILDLGAAVQLKDGKNILQKNCKTLFLILKRLSPYLMRGDIFLPYSKICGVLCLLAGLVSLFPALCV